MPRKLTGGISYTSTLSLPSALEWGCVVDTTPLSLYPRGKPVTYCIGDWVGSRAGLEGCGKCRLHPTWIRSPDRPAPSDSLYRLSYLGRILLVRAV